MALDPIPVYGVSKTTIQAVAVTPDDVDDIPASEGIYIGVTGDVKVDLVGGSTVTFKGLLAGQIHDIGVTRVYATGTTATDILAVY